MTRSRASSRAPSPLANPAASPDTPPDAGASISRRDVGPADAPASLHRTEADSARHRSPAPSDSRPSLQGLPVELLSLFAAHVNAPADRVSLLKVSYQMRDIAFDAYRGELVQMPPGNLTDDEQADFRADAAARLLEMTSMLQAQNIAVRAARASLGTEVLTARHGLVALRTVPYQPEGMQQDTLTDVANSIVSKGAPVSFGRVTAEVGSMLTRLGLPTPHPAHSALSLKVTVGDLDFFDRFKASIAPDSRSIMEIWQQDRTLARVMDKMTNVAQDRLDLKCLWQLAQLKGIRTNTHTFASLTELTTRSAIERSALLINTDVKIGSGQINDRKQAAVDRAISALKPAPQPSAAAEPAVTAVLLQFLDSWLATQIDGLPESPTSLADLLTATRECSDDQVERFYGAMATGEVKTLGGNRPDLTETALRGKLGNLRRVLSDSVLSARCEVLRDEGREERAQALEAVDAELKSRLRLSQTRCVLDLALLPEDGRDATTYARSIGLTRDDLRLELERLVVAAKDLAPRCVQRQVLDFHDEKSLLVLLRMAATHHLPLDRAGRRAPSELRPDMAFIFKLLAGPSGWNELATSIDSVDLRTQLGIEMLDDAAAKQAINEISHRALDRFKAQTLANLCLDTQFFSAPGTQRLWEDVIADFCTWGQQGTQDVGALKQVVAETAQSHADQGVLAPYVDQSTAVRTAATLPWLMSYSIKNEPTWKNVMQPLPPPDWRLRAETARSVGEVREVLRFMRVCVPTMEVGDALRLADKLARRAMRAFGDNELDRLATTLQTCFGSFAEGDLPETVVDLMNRGDTRIYRENSIATRQLLTHGARAHIRSHPQLRIKQDTALAPGLPDDEFVRMLDGLKEHHHESIARLVIRDKGQRSEFLNAYVTRGRSAVPLARFEMAIDHAARVLKPIGWLREANDADSLAKVVALIDTIEDDLVDIAPGALGMVVDSLALGVIEYATDPAELEQASERLTGMLTGDSSLAPQLSKLILQVGMADPEQRAEFLRAAAGLTSGGAIARESVLSTLSPAIRSMVNVYEQCKWTLLARMDNELDAQNDPSDRKPKARARIDAMPVDEVIVHDPAISAEAVTAWISQTASREQAQRVLSYIDVTVLDETDRSEVLPTLEFLATVALRTFSRAEQGAAGRQLDVLIGQAPALSPDLQRLIAIARSDVVQG